MYGRNFDVLVDIRAMNNFFIKKATKYLNLKVGIERELIVFKAINSSMKALTRILRNMQVKIGSWFGKLDLRVIEMDDHAMVLG